MRFLKLCPFAKHRFSKFVWMDMKITSLLGLLKSSALAASMSFDSFAILNIQRNTKHNKNLAQKCSLFS